MTMPDRLDTAIDHVASGMVAVPDDGAMTLRIVSALPERTSRLWRLIPQFAAIGAIVIAALVWTMRNDTTPAIRLLPSSEVGSFTTLARRVIANQPGIIIRTRTPPMAPTAPMARTGEADHERALAPIEVVSALVVSDLAPPELPATPALELAPIAITDLPLTAESFPPR